MFRQRYLHRFLILIILIPWIFLVSCRYQSGGTFQIGPSEEDKRLEAKLKQMAGRYHLTSLVLEDVEEMSRIEFLPDEMLPVMGDSGRKVVFEEQKTKVGLNSKKSILVVTDRNECHFEWDFNASNKVVQKSSFRLGRLKLSGRETSDPCFNVSSSAILPKALSPLNQTTYYVNGRGLVFESFEGSIRETLYYERSK